MIRAEDVFYIGRITKYRGICGEVELLFTDDAFDRGDAEFLVLEIEGILVPFFWEEYRFKNDKTAILKFEDIETETQAASLVGRRVFYPLDLLPKEEEETLHSLTALTGFTVMDEAGNTLGTIDAVDDSSVNVLLYITTPQGDELIIPYHDDFLTDYSLSGRSICLRLPEGLLDINKS